LDKKRGNEIWRSANRDIEIENFINDFVNELMNKPKSRRDSYCESILRDILQEKKIIGDEYE
jgi:hypothetical protein